MRGHPRSPGAGPIGLRGHFGSKALGSPNSLNLVTLKSDPGRPGQRCWLRLSGLWRPLEAKPDQAQSRRLEQVECNRSCGRAGCFPVFQISFENEPWFYTSATPSLSPKLVPPLLSGRRSYPRPRSPEREGDSTQAPSPVPGL